MIIIATNDKTVTIENTCPFCKKSRTLQVAKEAFNNWSTGMAIQRAMPNASADDREFFITGMCNDCFPKDPDA